MSDQPGDLADMRAREEEKRARRQAKMAAARENTEAEASLVPDLSGEIMEGVARLQSHEVFLKPTTTCERHARPP